MKIKLKHPSRHRPERNVNHTVHICGFRDQDMDLATPVVQFVADNFNEESLSLHLQQPGLIAILVPWLSTEVHDVLPQTEIEMIWDLDLILPLMDAIRGSDTLLDLTPRTLVVTVTYSDDKMYGAILQPPPGPPPEPVDRPVKTSHVRTPVKTYYWIAINGGSCAVSPYPLPVDVTVTPTPELLIGFDSQGAAKASQYAMLSDKLEERKVHLQYLEELAKSEKIVRIVPDHPSPPTHGQTMWSV